MNMLKALFIGLLGLVASVSFAAAEKPSARPTTEAFKKSVIYQILPQHFTQEGTLKKAEELIPHIKSLGVDIIYLCPVFVSDDDMNREGWSKRQKASGLNNPRNPYRMKDYFNVDSRFGTNQDLKDYIATAHSYGMKVILDLVYFHCGPTAVFIKDNPDFLVRDEKGNVKNGRWNFPQLNFDNPKLREYLVKNMVYFIKDYDADGYRTDVEPAVPADFWRQAYAEIKKLKSDVIMIAEGERADAQVDVYDANYSFKWEYYTMDVFSGKKPASELRSVWEMQDKKFATGSRLLRALDNHDTASDCCQPEKGGARYEVQYGNRGMDAIQVMNFTIDGIPFIYNGNEFADDAPFSMFGDNKHGRMFVAWENLATKEGWARMTLIRKLIKMRHEIKALWDGKTVWHSNCKPASILSYSRCIDGENVLVVINTSNAHVEGCVKVDELGSTKSVLEYGCEYKKSKCGVAVKMKPHGYIVLKY